MTTVLLATDSESTYGSLDAGLASRDLDLLRIRKGSDVLAAIEAKDPDMVLLDLQIGNMGGIAACLAIRQEEGGGRLQHRPVGLLLDRSVDKFLAQESGAEGWVIKPLSTIKVKEMVDTLLEGKTYFEQR